MKNLILLIALISTHLAYAGTCTSISRTNYTSGQVLTSSSLNSQLNSAYTAINAFDGGCVTSGTLEDDSLNATEFESLLKSLQTGCSVSYSTANTVIMSKCYGSVNGAFIAKSSTTSISMGCGSCSADAPSTTYYVYIATGSSGSTVTGLLSTTAPNADGYDNSGNKVVARLYNNASSDIDQYSIDQWVVNRFVATNSAWVAYTPTGTWTANTTYTGQFRRVNDTMEIQLKIATSGAPTAANLRVNLPTGYLIDTAKILEINLHKIGEGLANDSGGTFYSINNQYYTTTSIGLYIASVAGTYANEQNAVTQTTPFSHGAGDYITTSTSVPIVGWNP